MEPVISASGFDTRTRRHREVARTSGAPDLIRFHNELAVRLEKLAEASRTLFPGSD